MKAFAMIFLTFFLAKTCDAQLNEEMKDTTIEYQAMSRGLWLDITVHNEEISITKQRKGEAKTSRLAPADWKALGLLFKDVDAKKLPELKAPTEKRFYDGAAIATLKIIQDGKVYQTQGFDHGEPPAEIKKLVEKMLSFTTTE